MLRSIVMISSLAAFFSCSERKQAVTHRLENEKQTQIDDSKSQAMPQRTAAQLLDDAKSKLESFSDVDMLSKDADELANIKGISRIQALNELYMRMTDGIPRREHMKYYIPFEELILRDRTHVFDMVSSLPAGSLRTRSVSTLLGQDYGTEELAELCHRFPQSIDRTKILEEITWRRYRESGMDMALNGIESMETAEDRLNVTVYLATQLSGSHRLRKTEVAACDLEKLKSYSFPLQSQMSEALRERVFSDLDRIVPTNE